MRLEIEFESKNGSRVHNWDPARTKMQDVSDNNVFEALEPSRSL
jgi:hypothetical protein